jgi:pyruvate dehydrogenase E2 component (dihydrolipoamide acetyltransferase)
VATKVIMPKQGLQMTEGTIIKWLVKEGEKVKAEEPLFEIETDKVNVEIVANVSGILLKIIKEEGSVVPIAEIVAVIGKHNEDISDIIREGGAERIFSTPRARMVAKENNQNILEIHGSGPEGLIIERDVNLELNQSTTKKEDLRKPEKENKVLDGVIPFTGMRKAIADNMMKSIHGMAQANHRMKVDMTEIIGMREKLKENNSKVSFTDIITKIVSKALKDFPIVNSSLTDEGIVLKNYVNMGIAVALDNGLIVPVIKNSDILTIQEISKVSSELVGKAKTGKLESDDTKGGTFTITNLGMFDISEFTAIINPPESAILAVGKIEKVPVVVNDNIVIRPIMVLSLTYDHRVIDGAPAAQFLQRIKQIIQNPYLLFL